MQLDTIFQRDKPKENKTLFSRKRVVFTGLPTGNPSCQKCLGYGQIVNDYWNKNFLVGSSYQLCDCFFK